MKIKYVVNQLTCSGVARARSLVGHKYGKWLLVALSSKLTLLNLNLWPKSGLFLPYSHRIEGLIQSMVK